MLGATGAAEIIACAKAIEKGIIPPTIPKLLDEFALSKDEWLEYAQNFRRMFGSFAGRANSLYQCAQAHQQKWYKGVG